MKAVILAAGRNMMGSADAGCIPKCLLKFGTETILSRQIRQLAGIGLSEDDIIIVTGYCHEKVAGETKAGIVFNPDYDRYDNAYSLYLALKHTDDDILLLDGDIVLEDCVLSGVKECGENMLLVRKEVYTYGATGIVEKDCRISEIGKHVQSDRVYKGIAYISRDTARKWRRLLSNSASWSFWYTVSLNQLLNDTVFTARYISGDVRDINTHFDYVEAKRRFGIENYTILVTGATGFLGRKIYDILKRQYTVRGIGHTKAGTGLQLMNEIQSIDLTDQAKLKAYLELTRPQVVIHTAGMAEPDECAKNRERAYSLNVRATENLVNECRCRSIKLIHISTDYVFDGSSEDAYAHETTRNPVNYYGETKKQAEDIVSAYSDSLIVRIPILYGYNGPYDKETFPKRVVASLLQGKKMCLDNKQVRYPVLIDEAAHAVEKSLSRTGIMHVSSPEPCTKYTWAKAIADTFGLDGSLILEDPDSILQDRPHHVRLLLTDTDYKTSDIQKGTKILRKQVNCVFRLIYKSNPESYEFGMNVGQYRFNLGRNLGKQTGHGILRDMDFVVPVPASGLYYAMGFSEETGLPYGQWLVKSGQSDRSFQLSDASLREKVIRDKIIPIREMIRGKGIVLIDEAIFTGITLKVVCDMLKACGVRKIVICIPTPQCSCRCRQYVQPNRMLLAEEMGLDDMRNYFGADEIVFQSRAVFLESLGNIRNICCECFAEDSANTGTAR